MAELNLAADAIDFLGYFNHKLNSRSDDGIRKICGQVLAPLIDSGEITPDAIRQVVASNMDGTNNGTMKAVEAYALKHLGKYVAAQRNELSKDEKNSFNRLSHQDIPLAVISQEQDKLYLAGLDAIERFSFIGKKPITKELISEALDNMNNNNHNKVVHRVSVLPEQIEDMKTFFLDKFEEVKEISAKKKHNSRISYEDSSYRVR